MRELCSKEYEMISGGMTPGAAVMTIAVGLVILGCLSSYSPYGPKVTYQPVSSFYDVTTPMYDSAGNYLGYDIVNTYEKIDYVPVKIY